MLPLKCIYKHENKIFRQIPVIIFKAIKSNTLNFNKFHNATQNKANNYVWINNKLF